MQSIFTFRLQNSCRLALYIAQNTTKRIAVVFLTCLPLFRKKYQISKKPQQIIQRSGPLRPDVNNNIDDYAYYETYL